MPNIDRVIPKDVPLDIDGVIPKYVPLVETKFEHALDFEQGQVNEETNSPRNHQVNPQNFQRIQIKRDITHLEIIHGSIKGSII